MAMNHFSFKAGRLNLYTITLVTILCAAFYLVGVWQHSVGKSIAFSNGNYACTTVAATQNSTADVTVDLDFTAHHTASDLKVVTKARNIQLPPCDGKFSEYTPCEDRERSLKFDRDRLIYRERHCPVAGEILKCRIPAPANYKVPFRWPESRDFAWFSNVPHKELTVEKKKQNWVRYEKDRFRFPGGGTMFPHGADAYIDDIGKLINLADGSIRTAVDTGCG
ncbi:putative methyltransferase PMT15, partial [Cucurbita argyrosperma subsp. argyrosperma]